MMAEKQKHLLNSESTGFIKQEQKGVTEKGAAPREMQVEKKGQINGGFSPRKLAMLTWVGNQLKMIPGTGKQWEREIHIETVSLPTQFQLKRVEFAR